MFAVNDHGTRTFTGHARRGVGDRGNLRGHLVGFDTRSAHSGGNDPARSGRGGNLAGFDTVLLLIDASPGKGDRVKMTMQSVPQNWSFEPVHYGDVLTPLPVLSKGCFSKIVSATPQSANRTDSAGKINAVARL